MKGSGRRGFTLMELLVSMVLVVVAVGMGAFLVVRGMEGHSAQRFVSRFRALLAEARMKAVLEGREVFVHIDPRERRVWLGRGGRKVDIPQEVALESQGIEWPQGGVYSFPFYPDGSCWGGTFVVKKGDREWVLSLNPATGWVE